MNDILTGTLATIRDLYCTIRDVTARVLADFSVDALDALIRERSLLCARIEDERQRLPQGPHWWKATPEYREICGHIAAIAAFDREASARIRAGMHAIKNELVALDRSSRAARSYTQNCRV